MKDRIVLCVVLFFLFGSLAVSGSSLSQTFKSVFFGIAFTVLLGIGIAGFYAFCQKIARSKTH